MVIYVSEIIKEEIERLEKNGDETCYYKKKGKTYYGSRLKMLKSKLERINQNG